MFFIEHSLGTIENIKINKIKFFCIIYKFVIFIQRFLKTIFESLNKWNLIPYFVTVFKNNSER